MAVITLNFEDVNPSPQDPAPGPDRGPGFTKRFFAACTRHNLTDGEARLLELLISYDPLCHEA